MSLLERVEACRRGSLAGRLPFEIAGVRYGWVLPAVAARLAEGGEAFLLAGGRLTLRPDLVEPAQRTHAVERALRRLERAGLVRGWRGEAYPVVEAFGAPEALRVERAAAPLLGMRAFGVHVNAWVRAPQGLCVWVARRSRAKASHPGKLDHLVAGGQPAGLSLEANLIKECAEEAGLPEHLARRAVAAWPFAYRQSVPDGLRDDTLYVYDLELPGDFEPRPMDGEVESFELWSAERVLARLRSSEEFKYNVGPCLLGFLLRQGAIAPDDPERAALLSALAPPGSAA